MYYQFLSIEILSSVEDLVRVTSQQVKAARALLSWTAVQLAAAARVGKATIWRLESIDGPLGGEPETIAKIVGALEAAGIEFLDGSSPGVRMRPPSRSAAGRRKANERAGK
jgi:transcriptional regulator with XRE-family HTH domain